MGKLKFDRSSKGIEQLLRSEKVEKDIKRRTDAIAKAAGPGMRGRTYQGTDRVRGQVWTGTVQAQRAEAEGRALTRAVDAGRG